VGTPSIKTGVWVILPAPFSLLKILPQRSLRQGGEKEGGLSRQFTFLNVRCHFFSGSSDFSALLEDVSFFEMFA
jgi:hypothetical protein